MKRRSFMKSGIGTIAVGAADPVELGKLVVPNWANVSSQEMDSFLFGLDSAMNRILVDPASGNHLSKLVNQPLGEKDIMLYRESMRTLLLVGNFGDLSVEGQMHPGVQKRLKYSAPEIHSTMKNVMEKIKSLSNEDRASIKSALSDDVNLGDRILEAMDIEAGVVGAPNRRRKQMLLMGKRVLKRMKHSPDMIIEEYISKFEKIDSRPVSEEEMKKFMLSHMGEKAYKNRIQDAEEAVKRWQKMELHDMPIEYQPISIKSGELNTVDEEKADERYQKGLKLLGIAGITTAAGWILIGLGSAQMGFLFWLGVAAGVTIGPILIFIALIILLVQALKGPKK